MYICKTSVWCKCAQCEVRRSHSLRNHNYPSAWPFVITKIPVIFRFEVLAGPTLHHLYCSSSSSTFNSLLLRRKHTCVLWSTCVQCVSVNRISKATVMDYNGGHGSSRRDDRNASPYRHMEHSDDGMQRPVPVTTISTIVLHRRAIKVVIALLQVRHSLHVSILFAYV